jgi:DNA-binding NtrC family response regulator
MSGHVLVVDDDPGALRYMRRLLELEACRVQTASSGVEALEKIKQGMSPDLVFLDVLMPGIDGLQTLESMRKVDPQLKVVMLSCVRDTAKVVRAIRLGAEDYLHKPLDGAALQEVLKRFVTASAPSECGTAPDVEELPGGVFFAAGSPAMKKIRSRLGQVARVNVPVLLLGESGTGKEIAALMIHKLSSRSESVFLKVNCAAIPSELLESELFGYEAGAFTGATHAKPGKFELCNGGTILLDEIGEMPPGLQAKLLQVLQEQRFFRLGSRSTISVDVRILAATNIDIDESIKKGKLRLDLYYRLNAFTISLPPLRQRREDIPLLFRHFMHRLAAQFERPERPLSAEALEACMKYGWPGNIRELQNVVKRMVVLGDELHLLSKRRTSHSPLSHAVAGSKGGRDLKELVKALKQDAEAEVIAQALEQTNWNRREAAALLNISYKALVYKTRQYGLEDESSISPFARKSAAATAGKLSDAV